MQKKIKKRIISILLTVFVMIYLSISVSADIQVNKTYYCIVADRAQASVSMPQINGYPVTLSGSVDYSTLFVGWQTAEVIPDGTIVIAQMVISNIRDNMTTPIQIGAGQLASKAVTESHNGAFYLDMPYDQDILETTIARVSNGVRITIAYKASGYTTRYPFVRFYPLIKAESTFVVQATSINLYESIEDAAGSGVTPEEMREVLDQWTEESLLPGMEQSVQNGVTSGMEAALEDEKQQANTDGNSAIDELTSALDGVVSDINQAKESFETLGSALSYSGTSASITFPAMTVPFLGTISEAQPINLTEQIDNIMPPTLLLIIRCALSIGIVSYPIFELIHQLRKLLDKG